MATTSFVGGRLRVTHSDAYRASTSRTRSIDLATAGDVDALMVDTLRRNGFDAVHRVVVGPDRAKSRDVGPGKARRCRSPSTSATDEDAVVLLEHEGCYTWLRPRHETSRDPQVIGRVAVFEFVVPPAGAATATSAACPPGPLARRSCRMRRRCSPRPRSGRSSCSSTPASSTSPASTRPSGGTSARSPTPASRRTGTAGSCSSSTGPSTRPSGAFGALAATEPGRDFLTQALGDYDAVLGFDHKTLSVDPLRERSRARCPADAVPGPTGDLGRRLPQPRRAHGAQLRRVGPSGARLARQGRPGRLRRRHQRRHPLRGRDPVGRPGRPLHQPRGRQRAGDRRAAGRSTDRGPRRRRGPRHRRAGPMAGLVCDRPRQRPRHRRDGAGRAVRHRDQPRTSVASPVRGRPGSSCRRTSR